MLSAEPSTGARSHHIGKLSTHSSAPQQPRSLGQPNLWKSLELQEVVGDNLNPQPGETAALTLMETELDQLQLPGKIFPNNCYYNANLYGTSHRHI